MKETFTFTSLDKIFEFTIKSEFLEKVAEPTTISTLDLMTNHRMVKYLHNPFGPAIKVLTNGYEEFWLEGKRVSAEVAEKIKHNTLFTEEFNKMLDSDDENA